MSEVIPAFAAAVYTRETGDRMALLKFVKKQKATGIRIGGLLQEAFFSAEGDLAGINAIDVTTHERILISRPMRNTEECGLDISTLTRSTEVIARARSERVDLVVIEKFGNLEQEGKGLNDEILQTIADGIPLLISVPEKALSVWQERSGEMGSVIEFTEASFERWWDGIR